jgi:Ca2+/H+ antiporter, TMEM165/GDT1 family
VGVTLVAFGTFWGGEGVGVDWTLGDVTIPVLLLAYGAAAWLIVLALQRQSRVSLVPSGVGQ